MDAGTSDSRRAVLPGDFCGIGQVNPEREVIARANWAMFDVSLHNAGSFGALLHDTSFRFVLDLLTG